MENRCIVCDNIIPEGIQVCPNCWEKIMGDDDNENHKVCQSRI